jgi:F0F1-type ATP synthase membrane subunit a
MKSPLEQFDIINVKPISIISVDIALNNILIPFLFIIIMLIFFLFVLNNKFIIISSYIQSIFESIYIFLISLVKQQAHTYGLF